LVWERRPPNGSGVCDELRVGPASRLFGAGCRYTALVCRPIRVQYHPVVARPTARTCSEAAVLLRRLLDAVEEGRLDASSSHGARLLRRIEGAVLALEAVASTRSIAASASVITERSVT
jgi:hypothetical protein